MGSCDVQILGSWQSPYVLRTRVALNIKSVAYELQQENVLVAKSDLLLKSNPVYKKIPVLLHHANPICESLNIVQYIDEVWASGPPILPSDPYDRAIARFWANYIDVTVRFHYFLIPFHARLVQKMNIYVVLQWAPVFRANLVAEGEAATKAHEDTIAGLVLLDEAFTKCSKGNSFFGGEKIGYLDIALGGFLPWIQVTNKRCNIKLIDESKTPNLFTWAQHFCAHAAVKDILPDPDKLYEFSDFLVSVIKPSATN